MSKRITRVFGNVVQQRYEVGDYLKRDGAGVPISDNEGLLIFTKKPYYKIVGEHVEYKELFNFEGEPHFNYSFFYNQHNINLSADEEVAVTNEVFRADLNEVHLFVNKIEVIPVDEDNLDNKDLLNSVEKQLKLFNKILILSDEKLKNYCDLHKLDYEETDVEQVFKVVYPDKPFKFEDNKVIVSKNEDIKGYVIGADDSITNPWVINPLETVEGTVCLSGTMIN